MNKIKLRLERAVDTDKSGVELKDKEGNLLYCRNGCVALMQILGSTDNKSVSVNEYTPLLTLYDKVKDAWRKDTLEIELGIDEATLLKKILNNLSSDGRVSFGILHMRTINAVMEQLE